MSGALQVVVDARMWSASGIGVYLRNLLPRMMCMAGSRWRFTLLGSHEAAETFSSSGHWDLDVVECEIPIYSIQEQLILPTLIPASADLVWVPHYNIPIFTPHRLVVTVHDVLHVARPEFVRAVHRRWYARRMLAMVRARAKRIVVVSEFTEMEFTRYVGSAEGRIRVIHNGVSDSWFRGPERMLPDSNYVLFVGNLKPHKNVGALIDAVGQLPADIAETLLIVGEEYSRTLDPALRSRAEMYPGRVQFLGRVPDAELRDLVAGARALVLPSLYEGFGFPPLEAMAAGCPTLVSREGSLPEICGDAALYCQAQDPQDIRVQLERLLTDVHLRNDLRNRGRKRAVQFSWDVAAGQMLEVLGEAVSLR